MNFVAHGQRRAKIQNLVISMQMGSCFFGQEMRSLYLLAATVVTFVVEAAVVTATAVVVVVVVETFVF